MEAVFFADVFLAGGLFFAAVLVLAAVFFTGADLLLVLFPVALTAFLATGDFLPGADFLEPERLELLAACPLSFSSAVAALTSLLKLLRSPSAVSS